MSADTAECGCEGHADQQEPCCSYPDLRNAAYVLLQRLNSDPLASAYSRELELLLGVLRHKRIELTHECRSCYRYWTSDFVKCPCCGGVIVERTP